jgi:hypothetical protein
MNSDVPNICFSGGAQGADYYWGKCAEAAGHEVVHYSFAGHKTATQKHLRILTNEELVIADQALKLANTMVKRKWPVHNPYTASLLRRNYWQIKDSDRLYAISHFEPDGSIAGGTAWGRILFLQQRAKPAYIFDQNQNQWFNYSYGECRWEPICNVPVPTGLEIPKLFM